MINRITKTRKQNGKKNNYMDISSDKQTNLHTIKHGYSLEIETLREKLKIFKLQNKTMP